MLQGQNEADHRLPTIDRAGTSSPPDDRALFRAWKSSAPPTVQAQKFCEIPDIIETWLAPYGGFAGRDILDFGCGFGEMAAGIALGYDPGKVVGVDIQDKPARCEDILRDQLGLSGMPATLSLRQIEECGSLGASAFDLVISWSTLEHVRRAVLPATIADLWSALRPGGLAFVQISPLYFSPEGSHLWALGYHAWEHLLRQTSEVLADIEAAPGVTDDAKGRLVQLFSTLNRVTANDLKQSFQSAGFEVLREQRDRTDAIPEARLIEAYSLDALTTFQIVLLLRKPA